MFAPMLLFTWLAVSADTGEGGQSTTVLRTHSVAPASVYLLPLSHEKAPGQGLQLQAFSTPAGTDTGGHAELS